MSPIDRIPSLARSGRAHIGRGRVVTIENGGCLNRGHGWLPLRVGIVGFVPKSRAGVIIVGETCGHARVAKLRFAILSEGSQTKNLASSLEVVRTDSYDSNVVKMVGLEPCNGNGNFVSGRIADMNAIDLNSVFLHRSVAIGSSPAQGGGVGSNASKRHVGRLRHVDPENVNEVRDGFP